jgi:hypothetical protein
MPSWGNNDNAANAPYWAVNSTITKSAAAAPHSAPTAENVAYLFGNTTTSAYITNATIGLFGVSADEAQVDHKGAHPGWVMRTVGTGGRAGRVQEETLVALAVMNGDAEDAIYQDTTITITSQPVNKTVTAGAAVSNMFSVTATSSPTKSLQYQWQQSTNGGTSYTNISGTAWTGYTTNTLGITAGSTTTGDTGMELRCVVSASGTGASVTSTAGTLTVTA